VETEAIARYMAKSRSKWTRNVEAKSLLNVLVCDGKPRREEE